MKGNGALILAISCAWGLNPGYCWLTRPYLHMLTTPAYHGVQQNAFLCGWGLGSIDLMEGRASPKLPP